MRTIGAIADALYDAREEVKAAADALKLAQEALAEVEKEAYAVADEQGTTTGKGKKGSFTIGESVVPQVKDWDAFYKYIGKNKFYHLLERRPSVTGCRELFDTKGAIPGVEKFTKRKINLRGVE